MCSMIPATRVSPPSETASTSTSLPRRYLSTRTLPVPASSVERIEVEARRRVEVGRDRLGIAVHHDRRHASVAERAGGLHAAAIELDPLPDADRTAPENDGLRPRERRRLVLLLVGRVEVRRHRLEFR